MTDRPASWRMPTPKQMEKLAAGGRQPEAPHCGSGRAAPAPNTGNRSSAILAPRQTGAQSPFGRCAVRNSRATCCGFLPPMRPDRRDPDRRRSPACMAPMRSGRTSRSACSTTPASSAPAGMKKTAVGQGSSSHRRPPADVPSIWMSGWRRSITLRPYPEAIARL